MSRVFLLSTVLFLLAPRPAAAVDFSVKATVETVPVIHSGDIADDIAVWVHPTNPGSSVIIGTDKQGGLNVYELDGSLRQYLPIGAMNNVDIRYGMMVGGVPTDIVTASNRTYNTIDIYRVNHSTRTLENIAGDPIAVTMQKIYGFGMYKSPVTKKYYAIASSKIGEVEQWELVDNGSGEVEGIKVRSLNLGKIAEGIVADDESGHLYIAEEDTAIWKYGAEPDAGSARTAVAAIGQDGLVSDIEGLTIYYGPNGTGYLIASNQGANQYNIYKREGGNQFITRFNIIPGQIDGVSDTDGIDVSSFGLGSAFPQGAFIAQDYSNDGQNQNFKIVPWERIANGGPTQLMIHNTVSPRMINPGTGIGNPEPLDEVEFTASADATVSQASPGQNFGSSSILETDGSPIAEAYLKFDVSSINRLVVAAKVRLYVTNGSTGGYQIYETSSGWSELGINYSNRSQRISGVLDSNGTNNVNTFIDFDVSNAVLEQGIYSFVIAGASSNGMDFHSRTAAKPPKLILTLADDDIPPVGADYEFIASEDATVKQSEPAQTFGNAATLEVDGSPRHEAFLKFNVQGIQGQVSSAKVQLFVTNKSSAGPGIYSSGSNWSESTITYNNKPATTSATIDSKGAVEVGAYVDFDVSSVVSANGTYSFVLFQSGSDRTDFSSRSGANPPKLSITTTP